MAAASTGDYVRISFSTDGEDLAGLLQCLPDQPLGLRYPIRGGWSLNAGFEWDWDNSPRRGR
jgi:hypothetical protein